MEQGWGYKYKTYLNHIEETLITAILSYFLT